jgi:hypothetical protein
MRTTLYAAATGLMLSVVVYGGARAADPGFCDDYARAALRQIDVANRSCAYPPDLGSGRWIGGYRRHYDWCLGVSYRQAGDEREARREILDRCGRR